MDFSVVTNTSGSVQSATMTVSNSVTTNSMTQSGLPQQYSPLRRIYAWLIHLFTASAAILGLYTLYAIYQGQYILAFWLMGATIFIDSVDGTLARLCGVKSVVPRIDGALLDNIVDYFNYVITPAFFLLVSHLMPVHWEAVGASCIILASAYQFTQSDAKTADHFFKGFPSYWHLVVFYLFLADMNPWLNFAVVVLLSVLIFVPIKYVYLSRLDHVTRDPMLKGSLIAATILYGVATIGLLALYPQSNIYLVIYSWFFGILYCLLSLYRTFKPIPSTKQ